MGVTVSRLKALGVNLALFTVVSLLCFVVIEVFCRMKFPQYSPSAIMRYERNAEGVPLGVPNTSVRQFDFSGEYNVGVSFNKYGLRDEKDLSALGPDDILVVGDSFSFGHGVEESERYSNVLQSALGRPVYNIAIPGDIEDYVRLVEYARRNGASIGRMIIGICMENDLKPYSLVEAPTPTQSVTKDLARVVWGLHLHLTIRLASYNTFVAYVLHSPELKSFFAAAGLYSEKTEKYAVKNKFSEKVIDDSVAMVGKVSGSGDAVILIIPSRRLWFDEAGEEAAIHEAFVAKLRVAGYEVVDMKGVFEATGNPIKFYFKRDGHWTAEGHRLATEALIPVVERWRAEATPGG